MIAVEERLPGQRETVAVGGGPRAGASPTRVSDLSERSSEPLEDSTSLMYSRRIGTATAESREQEDDQQGRVRTLVVWGQGDQLSF